MENIKVGFIGGGNMGGALARAAIKVLGGENVFLADNSPTNTKILADNIGAVPSTAKEIATNCRLVFLSVKPNIVPVVAETVRPVIEAREDECAVVSIAAGVTLDSLSEMLGEKARIIRMMPNTSVAVGEGMIVYDHRASEHDVDAFEFAMSNAGMVSPLPERLIDAATAVMGCGPAFAYQFAEALADGGVSCGLTRVESQIYAAQMMLGAAKMLLETGKHPGELKDAVCSPGGSTIEGVRTLEANGLRTAVIEAVVASYEKTKQLGKK